MSGDSCQLPLHRLSSQMACPKSKTCSYRAAVGLGNKYVRLNVGGTLFYTTLQVLTRQDSMLKAMFSGRKEVFIDREDEKDHFASILTYLQGPLELLAEAKYYLIQGLVELCQGGLQDQKEQSLCVIPVVTSAKEEERLIQACTMPVVKLLYKRSNNKYSYTSNSDDNLLKNIELFDKLSLNYNGRVLFIKDVIGDEICCWSFYGQGRKLAEVCCTSIVYATEKKQTKVEFPEARIYEETLNALLYETLPVPDDSLLEATRRRHAPPTLGYSNYDDRPLGH
uniref:BTB/POZ domain-containing adapter for CUL3-mediated RhoA degradation protein 2 n=1 Tax=Oncorhynchus tshawytscha TaxID=74940 RepID=A0A8C8EJE4_ONCTS